MWTFTTQPQLTLSANPLIGGTVSGGGLFNAGTSVTATAVANAGYVFSNWTEAGVVVSTNANYTFTLAGNRTLAANFTAQYSVTLSSLAIAGGTTTGGGLYNAGASVTVSAVPTVGYTFTNWTEGTTVVSTLKDFTFPISANRVLVANFAINMYVLNVTALNGTVAKNPNQTTFSHGTSVQLTATPNSGYSFTSWSGDAAGTTNAATIIMTSDKNVTANFSATQYTVALSANPLLGGTTSGGGSFNSGASVTLNAVANVGYTFKNWTDGANIVSSNSNYTFTVSSNKTFVANFTANVLQNTVVLSSLPLLGGTTSGGGSFNSGASVTVNAVPAIGYTFKNWTDGAVIASTNANYTFIINSNKTLIANFEPSVVGQFNVSLSSNPLLGGTTNGGGSFNSGASVTITAVPANGFTFTNWTEGANIASTNANYTFIIAGNRTFVANFKADVIPPVGPAPINLGSSGNFSILTKSGISSTGITSVQGNIGVSPAAAAAITGFGLIMDTNGQSSHTTIATHVTGKVYASDYAPPTPSNLTVAVSDMENAYTTANNLVTPAPVLEQGAGNLSGLTLAPGLYKWSTGVLISSNSSVTLSGGANDTWVFQIAQDLTLLTGAKVNLIGGAQAKNITWVVAGQAVLGSQTELYGTIMSKTLISLNTGSKVTGRLLAQTAVTLNASTVVAP